MIGERDSNPRERLARCMARYVFLRTIGTYFGDYLSPDERHRAELSHFAKVREARAWLAQRRQDNVIEFPSPASRRAD